MTLHDDPQTRLRRVIVEDFVVLPDVLPGKSYETTIRPAEPMLLGEVLVRDFALERLIVGALDQPLRVREASIEMESAR